MPNRFFEEADIQRGIDTAWRGKVAEELRRRNPFRDLYAAAVYSAPEIHLYHKEHFMPYGAKLILQMGEDGLGVGLYLERGYVWAAEAGWTLQPHWDWHHFMYLLGSSPEFVALFRDAQTRREDFGFWIQSGEADAEELSLYASKLPLAALLGMLNAWPGNLWCDFYFSCHIPGDLLVRSNDELVMGAIVDALSCVEPTYRAILARKLEIEARSPAFSGSGMVERGQ